MARAKPIAIVDAACVVPRGLATDLDLFALLLRGESLLRPQARLGTAAPVSSFDDGHPGHAAAALASAALRAVWPRWRDAAGRPALFVATAKGDLDDWLAHGRPEGIPALLARLEERVSDLPTDRRVISNACVSGAQAAIEAAHALIDGECDRALLVGADGVSAFVAQGFAALNGLSPAGARPFDATRDGLSLGEAGAAAILCRADAAPRAPRLIGWGASNDANHISGPSRDGSGLALAIDRALQGIDRRQIIAICGHGTGTPYNDAMEARAFHAAFAGQPPPVFGIKGAIGHTLGAAALIELAVSAQVACTGVIPPTTGFTRGDSDYPLDVVHGTARRVAPGLVLSTNSGFGGMNTALVIAPGEAPWPA